MKAWLVVGIVALTASSARAQSTDDAGLPPAREADASVALPPEPPPPASMPPEADLAAEVLAAEPQPGQEIALSESELTLLGLEPSKEAVDKTFHFWGFADFTSLLPSRRSNAASAAVGRRHSFYIGNVNLYLSRNLSETFRTLGEIRFTYLPNGGVQPHPTELRFVDTQILDYADTGRITRWGGIIMQRIYLEWTLHRYLTVRGGQFLTPFGIWNVDHGSPAYIPVQRPYVLNSTAGYFPERQTGLELLGRWDMSNTVAAGYHLTLSNGGGSVAEYRDFDRNKAVGARIFIEHHGLGYLRIGSSGYYGRETNAVPAPRVTQTSIELIDNVQNQFDGLALAADILYKVRGLQLQAEVVTQQRRYTEKGRRAQMLVFAPAATGFPQNFLAWGGYVLAAYEFPWYALTPYVDLQHSREVLASTFAGYVLDVWLLQVGFNIHPIDEVVFKAEFVHNWFNNGGPLLAKSMDYFQLQAAWAF
ncbi:MAG: hypothetical protein ABW252_09570 [Polyangiales bacterium]